ncbi:NADH:ubiquinone oxidoreductase [Allomyces arbusculus]|nr:NADH:ubiquinone oxidoreductase [Allomyces arbusculus]
MADPAAADPLAALQAQVADLTARLAAKETELDEFQADSREYEEELEREVARFTAQNTEITKKYARAQHDLEALQARFQDGLREAGSMLEVVQAELAVSREEAQIYRTRVTELEYENDMLTRRKRELEAALQDLEMRYHRVLETQVALETELEDKLHLDVDAQRLRDQLRDLQHDLEIRDTVSARASASSLATASRPAGIAEDVPLPPFPVATPPSPTSQTDAPSPVSGSPPTRPRDEPRPRPAPTHSVPLLARTNSWQLASLATAPDAGATPPSTVVPPSSSGITTARPPVAEMKAGEMNALVQQMMARVKGLESRLATCRTMLNPLLKSPSPASSSGSSLPGTGFGSRRGSHASLASPRPPRPPSALQPPLPPRS